MTDIAGWAGRAGWAGLAGIAGGSPPSPWAALVPLVALVPAVVCMIDITRHPHTRALTPRAWLAICAFGNVAGLVAYLKYGRDEDR
ncbi:hypothetical protein [Actinacidiphila rubida]|uniref:Phospholipase_D-nuclease N-terminal n=1 Tax=Actinacidiphila rubida TaxID=310780 RepID=A0A1H8LKE5_9ACTN|nr:hypothetical protein [Actinacidiphila rubida]SEO05559.1 Phospholipase_D-nuclease N-terminal [Actinacidiphila rubida]